VDDTVIEGDETVIATLTATGSALVTINPAAAEATVTIVDNEMDFGDAPDPTYPTLLANNGLGTC